MKDNKEQLPVQPLKSALATSPSPALATTASVLLTPSTPVVASQPTTPAVPKKESKIRVGDDAPFKPTSIIQPQPLAEWEQANILAALAAEEVDDKESKDKKLTSPTPAPGVTPPLAQGMESGTPLQPNQLASERTPGTAPSATSVVTGLAPHRMWQ